MNAPGRTPAGWLQAAVLVALSALPNAAAAWETQDGKVALHGYYEMPLRWISRAW